MWIRSYHGWNKSLTSWVRIKYVIFSLWFYHRICYLFMCLILSQSNLVSGGFWFRWNPWKNQIWPPNPTPTTWLSQIHGLNQLQRLPSPSHNKATKTTLHAGRDESLSQIGTKMKMWERRWRRLILTGITFLRSVKYRVLSKLKGYD